jgi:asparagine synthase (glutamine-hydrolysing)
MDEPVGDQAMLPLYWLSREAAKVVKVVLSGEGADEIFGGYDYYPRASGMVAPGWRERIKNWLRHDRKMALLQANGTTPSGFPLLTGQGERRAWLGLRQDPNHGRWYSEMMAGWSATKDPLRRACLADIETWLAEDLLMKLDKIAMAHSLEGRAPYLCPRLARLAFNLPAKRKLVDGANKIGLREIGSRLLPPAICQRRKQGFVLPMREWLRDYLQPETVEAIASKVNLGIGANRLSTYLTGEVQAGVVRERLTYAVIVLAKWAEFAEEHVRQMRSDLINPTVSAA